MASVSYRCCRSNSTGSVRTEFLVGTGLRSVVAESLLVKQQLPILNRGRSRARDLRAGQRFIAGLCILFMNPARVCTNLWTN